MIRNHLLLTILIGFVMLSSCIIPNVRRERAELELQRNDSLLTIDKGEFNFSIVMPKDLMIAHSPSIHLSADKNTMHINCGDDFQLQVTIPAEPVSASTIGNAREGAFNHHLLDCEDESCVYKRVLPDGSTFDYGLYQLTAIGKTIYAFQSAPDGEFDLGDAMRMKLAIASVKI